MTAIMIDGQPANIGRYPTGFGPTIWAGEWTDAHGQPVRCHVESGYLAYAVRVGRTPQEVIDALRRMPVHLRPPRAAEGVA